MKIKYFAWLRQRTGRAEEHVDPPASVTTVAALAEWLAVRHPGFGEALASPGVVRFAVNQQTVDSDAPVAAGDEVAFFPPITGG